MIENEFTENVSNRLYILCYIHIFSKYAVDHSLIMYVYVIVQY